MAKPKVLSKPLTKSDLVAEVSASVELTKQVTSNLFDLLVIIAKDEVQKSGEFTIPGIGKLVIVNRKARMGRNPATGETIKIPAKRALKFKISSVFKREIK